MEICKNKRPQQTHIYTKISLRAWGSQRSRSSSGLAAAEPLGLENTAKTLLFAAPEPLGHRNTSENTTVRCSGATWAPEYLRKHCCSLLRNHSWAPEYLRKHCCSLLRSHLGAGMPPTTLLLAAPEPFVGTGIPPKTLLFAVPEPLVAPEPLGDQYTSERTDVRCSRATWAPECLRKHCCSLLHNHWALEYPDNAPICCSGATWSLG